jgi:hypothetical protein
VQRLRDANVLLAVRGLRARQRLLEQRLRLVEDTEPAIRSADRREDLRLQLRLADQFLLHLVGARIEQTADRGFRGRRAAIRIRAGQQADHQLADFGGFLGFVLRAVALGREPRRVERRGDDERHDQGRRRRYAARVPADEPRRPIRQRIGPRADRLVMEEAAQIVGQRRHRRIPLSGFFFSALATMVSRSPRSCRRSRLDVVPQCAA